MSTNTQSNKDIIDIFSKFDSNGESRPEYYIPSDLALVWYLNEINISNTLIIAPDKQTGKRIAVLAKAVGLPINNLPALPDTKNRRQYIEALEKIRQNIDKFSSGNSNLIISIREYQSNPLEFEDHLTISKNREIDYKTVISKLQSFGYKHKDRAFEAGDFRARGDIIDINIPGEGAFRIELIGNQVETISRYQVLENKRQEEVEQIKIPSLNLTETEKSWDEITSRPKVVYKPEKIKDTDQIKDPKIKLKRIKSDQAQDLGFQLPRASETDEQIQSAESFFIITDKPLSAEKWFSQQNLNKIPEIIETPVQPGEGFYWETTKDLVLTGAELNLQQQEKDEAQKTLQDFEIGDYVTHIEHGIGKALDIRTEEVGGEEKEFLIIQYARGDKLYVPRSQMDKVYEYIAPGGDYEPKLSRLHTEHWQNVIKKVKKDTLEYAKELLELHAEREIKRGLRVELDSTYSELLDKTFEHELTPDQNQALQEILNDMQKPKPMDRLLTADVGFGKTEVAIRAALQAVQSGYQAAVLAPTTILVQQHEETFRERLEDIGVKVDSLSRFKTNKEQNEVTNKLKSGELDIVIGTHRLLQDDIDFENLGFLIIDEEQRFGVKHKEKLKMLRKNIDVLSMTATPIPRTLNLALAGMKDLSAIETPPKGRKPIGTEVKKLNFETVHKAILKEIRRGGQVYLVFNNVKQIPSIKVKLAEDLPEVEFISAHGQMPNQELEERMEKFRSHQKDVLISSTIIENGLDNPNVNTLIVLEAQKFGLSQLHQLRGRVGRGKVKAHALLLYNPNEMTDDAIDRLEALSEHTELGKGKEIAMRDLQIRGGGGILTTKQSGSAKRVGLAIYNKLLNQAIEKLKTGENTL